MRQERVEVDLGDRRTSRDAVGLAHRGVQLAGVADHFLTEPELGAATGVFALLGMV